ncbi:MAG: hypothetical protein Kow0081_3950 [Candidatus Dojkabacteria bacterium]
MLANLLTELEVDEEIIASAKELVKLHELEAGKKIRKFKEGFYI